MRGGGGGPIGSTATVRQLLLVHVLHVLHLFDELRVLRVAL